MGCHFRDSFTKKLGLPSFSVQLFSWGALRSPPWRGPHGREPREAPSSHRVSLEVTHSSAEPHRHCSLTPEPEDPAQLHRDSQATETMR